MTTKLTGMPLSVNCADEPFPFLKVKNKMQFSIKKNRQTNDSASETLKQLKKKEATILGSKTY